MTTPPLSRRPPRLLPGIRGPAPGATLAMGMLSIVAGLIIVAATVGARALAPWPDRLDGRLTLAVGGGGALALLVALLLSVWILVSGGVKAAARRNRERLALLTHLGATEATLEKPLRGQGLSSAVLGAALGAAVVGLGVAALIWSPVVAIGLAARGLNPPALDAADVIGVAAWPLVVAAVAALAAGAAARAAVRRFA